MNTIFDPTKPVQTRDGRPARIICTDKKGKYPIVALILEGEREHYCAYHNDGKSYEGCVTDLDLINIKPGHDRRVELAHGLYTSPRERAASIAVLEYINWPACAERP